MASTSPSKLQSVGTIVAIALGLWGAGLSTYQAWQSHEASIPQLFTQMSVSRESYTADTAARPATINVGFENSGQVQVSLLSPATIIVSNPGSGFSRSYPANFSKSGPYELPVTLQPGTHALATATITDSAQVFGPDLQYAILAQSTDGRLYFSSRTAGPIKTAEAYEAMQKYVRYQSKVDFQSSPATVVRR